MSHPLYIFLSITGLYVLILLLRQMSWFKVCALCGSVSATWIILLGLYITGTYIDPVLIGIFMGGSIVGVLELISKRVPDSYQIFKFIFYVTLVVIAYALLLSPVPLSVVLFLLFLWIVSLFVYLFRHNERIRSVGRHIIACCKNW